MYKKNSTIFLWVIGLICCSQPLQADYIMGPREVNHILKNVQKSMLILRSAASTQEKEQAIFDMGVQGYTLMKLINAEISSHGDLQKPLIDLAIRRCRNLGIEIQYIPQKRMYLYDFDEFGTYLQMAPRGKYAAEASFALMEKSFYEQEAGDREPTALMEQVQRKIQLLEEYPDFSRRAELEFFITLDYYELHVIFFSRKEEEKSREFKKLVMEQCRHIIESYPETPAALSARDLLIRIEIQL